MCHDSPLLHHHPDRRRRDVDDKLVLDVASKDRLVKISVISWMKYFRKLRTQIPKLPELQQCFLYFLLTKSVVHRPSSVVH